MSHVTITATALGFRVKINRNGEILGSPLTIMDYSRRFEHREYDKANFRWVLTTEFFHFDPDRETCYFPRYDLDAFKDWLAERRVTCDVVELAREPGKPVSFLMLPHVDYKSDIQKNAIEFLVEEKSGPLRGLALQTGQGKTVSYIWALQKMGIRSITTMTSRLEQWVKEMHKYTTLEEDDIYVVQGVGALTKLFSQIDKTLFPKVILFSTKTFRLYMEYGPGYQHLPHPSLICEMLKAGIVGTDEYHEHFYTNFLIGIMLNPSVFIPITATFIANNQFVKEVFNKFVPKAVQFYGGEYKKYTNVTAYHYRNGGHMIKPFHYMSPKGYSQSRFEKNLLTRLKKLFDLVVEDAILPIIKTHYSSIAVPGEKLLFLCSTTDMCDYLEGVFKRVFKDKKISVFYSGMPVTILERYDIILSTPGSAGTGRDIANLRTCFAFENTGSETRNLQFIGRLRDFPSVKNTPEYVYLTFDCIAPHVKYSNMRAMLYGPRSLEFRHRSIS